MGRDYCRQSRSVTSRPPKRKGSFRRDISVKPIGSWKQMREKFKEHARLKGEYSRNVHRFHEIKSMDYLFKTEFEELNALKLYPFQDVRDRLLAFEKSPYYTEGDFIKKLERMNLPALTGERLLDPIPEAPDTMKGDEKHDRKKAG